MRLKYETWSGEVKTGNFEPAFMHHEIQVVTRDNVAYFKVDQYAIRVCGIYNDDWKEKFDNFGQFKTEADILNEYRKKFEEEKPRTEIALLLGYSAEEIEANRQAFAAERAVAREARRRTEEENRRERERLAEEKRKAYFSKLSNLVINSLPISGSELADLCKHLGIPVNIRTIGTLRRRVLEVQPGSARSLSKRKGQQLPASVWRVYYEAQEKLNAIR